MAEDKDKGVGTDLEALPAPVEVPEYYPGFTQQFEALSADMQSAYQRLQTAEQNLLSAAQSPMKSILPEGLKWATSPLVESLLTDEERLRMSAAEQAEFDAASNAFQLLQWKAEVMQTLPIYISDPFYELASPEDILKYIPPGVNLTDADRVWLTSIYDNLQPVTNTLPKEYTGDILETQKNILDNLLEEPKVELRGVHQLTVEEIAKAFAFGVTQLPAGMTEADVRDMLSQMDLNDEELVSQREWLEQRAKDWATESARMQMIKAGELLAEVPDLTAGEVAKMIFTQPMMATVELMNKWWDNISRPISAWLTMNLPAPVAGMLHGLPLGVVGGGTVGAAIGAFGGPIGMAGGAVIGGLIGLITGGSLFAAYEDDADKELTEIFEFYQGQGESAWSSYAKAFNEWDAPWWKKMILDSAYDPMMWIGWGGAVAVGRKLTTAALPRGLKWMGTRVGPAMIAFERGYMNGMDALFKVGVETLQFPVKGMFWLTGAGYQIPKTFTQMARNFGRQTMMNLKAVLDRTFPHVKSLVGLTGDDIAKTVRKCIDAYMKNPMEANDLMVRTGANLMEYGYLDEAAIAKLLRGVVSDLAIDEQRMARINTRVLDAFSTTNNKMAAGNILAEMGILTPTDDMVTTVMNRLIKFKDSVADKVLRMAKGEDAKEVLLKIFNNAEELRYKNLHNPVTSYMQQAGRSASWHSRVADKILHSAGMVWLERRAVMPFARWQLLFFNFGPWNFGENIIRSALGGAEPMHPAKYSGVHETNRLLRGLPNQRYELLMFERGQVRTAQAIIDPATKTTTVFKGGKIPFITRDVFFPDKFPFLGGKRIGLGITIGGKQFHLGSALDLYDMWAYLGADQMAYDVQVHFLQSLEEIAPDAMKQIDDVIARTKPMLDDIASLTKRDVDDIVREMRLEIIGGGPESIRGFSEIDVITSQRRKISQELNRNTMDKMTDLHVQTKKGIENDILDGTMFTRGADGIDERVAGYMAAEREMQIASLANQIDAIEKETEAFLANPPRNLDDFMGDMQNITTHVESVYETIHDYRRITELRKALLDPSEVDNFEAGAAKMLADYMEVTEENLKKMMGQMMENARLTIPDPNVYYHITPEASAEAIKNEGFSLKKINESVGLQREFDASGISLTQDKHLIDTYAARLEDAPIAHQETLKRLGDRKVLTVNVKKGNVLDLMDEKVRIDDALVKRGYFGNKSRAAGLDADGFPIWDEGNLLGYLEEYGSSDIVDSYWKFSRGEIDFFDVPAVLEQEIFYEQRFGKKFVDSLPDWHTDRVGRGEAITKFLQSKGYSGISFGPEELKVFDPADIVLAENAVKYGVLSEAQLSRLDDLTNLNRMYLDNVMATRNKLAEIESEIPSFHQAIRKAWRTDPEAAATKSQRFWASQKARKAEIWAMSDSNTMKIKAQQLSASRNFLMSVDRPAFVPDFVPDVVDYLTPNHLCYLYGCTGDDLYRGLTRVQRMTTVRPKDDFIMHTKELANAYGAKAGKTAEQLGFTDDAIGEVYDQMWRSLGIDPNILTPDSPTALQIEEVRQELHRLHAATRLSENDVAKWQKWVNSVASSAERTTPYKTFNLRPNEQLMYHQTSSADVILGEGFKVGGVGGATGHGARIQMPGVYLKSSPSMVRPDIIGPDQLVVKAKVTNPITFDTFSDFEKWLTKEGVPIPKVNWFEVSITEMKQLPDDIVAAFTKQHDETLKLLRGRGYDAVVIKKDRVPGTVGRGAKYLETTIVLDPDNVIPLGKMSGQEDIISQLNKLSGERDELATYSAKVMGRQPDGHIHFGDPDVEELYYAIEKQENQLRKKLAMTELELPKEFPTSVPARPEFSGTPQWWKTKEQAMDRANELHALSYPTYDDANIIDETMRAIFPFWNYELFRWKWIPRTFMRTPGTMSALARYMNYTDSGYLPVPGTDLQLNILRGSIFMGGLRSFYLRDFPEYHDAVPGIEFLDYIGRAGFFPGIHVMLPIVLFGTKAGHMPEFSQLAPAWADSALSGLRALSPEHIGKILDVVYPDRFRDYMTMMTLASWGYDGDEIWSKKQQGQQLTEEEDKLWLRAVNSVDGIKGVLMNQTGLFRIRPDEFTQIRKEMRLAIEEATGVPVRIQEWIDKMYPVTGKRFSDYFHLDVQQQALLYQWESYRRYQGIITPLYPSSWQSLDIKINEYYTELEDIFNDARYVGFYKDGELIQQSMVELNRQLVEGIIGPDQWRSARSSMQQSLGEAVRILGESPAYTDVPKTFEERAALLEERGIVTPTQTPDQELLYYYFELEPKLKYDWESDRMELDFDTYYAQIDILLESLSAPQRERFLERIHNDWTPMEILYWEFSREYARPYRNLRTVVMNQYSEEERMIIRRYEVARGDEREAIKEIIGPDGKLIADYQSKLREARLRLRMLSPELDAWLYFFGTTDTFRSTTAKEIYDGLVDKYLQPTMIGEAK